MQLSQENPDFSYVLRGTTASTVLVNQQALDASFVLAPNQLVENWGPASIDELEPGHMDTLLALKPSVAILGTGPRQRFPSPAVMAAMLTRGVGLEVMDNAAAARTFNVLATEGRTVVVAFLLPG
ncbi:Mth938-like domain-containing protein [Arenimonas aestuarii]